ncbi:hypothetical protein WJX74_002808 [Apatococcus lobatus]|uniref:Translin n=2 Tax=Apatococcus TaxID=904362 RepID=A0AAW1T098_9CHLO
MALKRSFAEASSGVSSLLDSSDFTKLREDASTYDETREKIIKRSRDIQKNSKQAIFSLHRGDLDQAASRLLDAEKGAHELLPLIQGDPSLRHGSFSSSIEEFAEAKIFQVFLKEQRLINSSELQLADRDEYLGGVLDFTGELNRFSIAKATTRDTASVRCCRDLVEALMGEFLQFDLRNGALRKKYDSLKYTLKKMEDTLYQLSLAEAGLKPKAEEDPVPAHHEQTTMDEA